MDTTRASLLVRIRNRNDSASWSEFDAIYRPMLLRFAITKGLREADAEDVVQHCMTAIHEHIGSFEYDPTRGRFKGWLRTLVNNRIRNLMRDRHDRLAETKDFQALEDEGQGPDELFDQVWMDEHLKHCLRRVRAEIEETTFKAFQHYVIDEWPIDKVCAELGMNANQVHAIKWRVTKKLREHMRELAGEES